MYCVFSGELSQGTLTVFSVWFTLLAFTLSYFNGVCFILHLKNYGGTGQLFDVSCYCEYINSSKRQVCDVLVWVASMSITIEILKLKQV